MMWSQGWRVAILLALVSMAMGVLAVPSPAQELRTVNFTTFGARRPVTQAADLGFFERRGIRVKTSTTQASEPQMQALLDRRYDIASSDADNFVYWTQDRGAEFVIFMVGEGPPNNQFYVSRDIQSFEDLRGQVLAVDSASSGQSTTLRLILLRNGLEIDRDYTFLSVGDSATRARTIAEGRAVGASLNQAAADSPDGLLRIPRCSSTSSARSSTYRNGSWTPRTARRRSLPSSGPTGFRRSRRGSFTARR
jgi:ABC-type nitrate/sulfonate/bicarbonate transport system substrate-binding protein